MSVNGDRTVDSFHRELGRIMWDYCGMERSEESLTKALELIPPLREEFWRNVRVPGSAEDLNQSLEMAGTGRGLHGAGRIAVHRRAGPQRIVRGALPGRVPDGGRRSAAR